MLIAILEMLGLKRPKAEAGPGLFVQALMRKVGSTPEDLERRQEVRFEMMRDTADQLLRQVATNWGSEQLDLLSARLRMAQIVQKSQLAIDDAWSWYIGTIDQSVPELRSQLHDAINPIALEFGDEGQVERDRLIRNAEEAFRKTMILMGRDLKEAHRAI